MVARPNNPSEKVRELQRCLFIVAMDAYEVDQLLKTPMSDPPYVRPQSEPQYDAPCLQDGGSILELTPLPDGVTIICEYPNNPTSRNLLSFRILRFDDLKPQIPDDLFSAVRLVHLAPSAVGKRFDPSALIRSVNGLHALGKQTTLRALRAYSKLARDDWKRSWEYDMDERRAFIVARVLFAQTEGPVTSEIVKDGIPYPKASCSDDDWPLFPLVIEKDIPFCLIDGYFQSSSPESLDKFLESCERVGVFRDSPLSPKGTLFQAAESLTASSRWTRRFAGDEAKARRIALIRIEALRAATPLLKVLKHQDWTDLWYVSPSSGDSIWKRIQEDKRLSRMEWDVNHAQFIVRGERPVLR